MITAHEVWLLGALFASAVACGSSDSGSGQNPGDGGVAGTGGSAGGTCLSGSSEECYPGDAATRGVGQCVSGTRSCIAGVWLSCVGAVLPESEVCNGIDDDCDGSLDEGCSCTPGATRSCYDGPAATAGVGECKNGSQTCDESGSWGTCSGSQTPQPETCDQKDNDCNGETDSNGPCTVSGEKGECAKGTSSCDASGAFVCISYNSPAVEKCNGLDDDCSGAVDDGCTALAYDGGSLPADSDAEGLWVWEVGNGQSSGNGYLSRYDGQYGAGGAGTSLGAGHPYAVSVDSTSAWTAGAYSAEWSIGGKTHALAGGSDLFVAKYPKEISSVSSFAPSWVLTFGSTDSDQANAIEARPNGGAIVAGYYKASIDFGKGALPLAGLEDGFVAAVSSAGSIEWAYGFGSTAADAIEDVAVAGDGSVYALGTISGAATLGTTAVSSAGGKDLLVIKLSATGQPAWAKTFGGVGNDAAGAILLSGAGEPTIAATIKGSYDFGNGAIGGVSDNVVVFRLDATGKLLWATAAAGSATAAVKAMDLTASGDLLVTGYFESGLDFGSKKLWSNGGEDVLIAKVSSQGKPIFAHNFGNGSGYILAFETGAIVESLPGKMFMVSGRYYQSIFFGDDYLTTTGSKLGTFWALFYE